MGCDLESTAEAVAEWAQRTPRVAKVWFFGSRVRGDHRPDSDLDIGIEVIGRDRRSREGNWIFLSGQWEAELSALTDFKIHLKHAEKERSELIVARAIQREGILVFSRS